MNKRRLLDCQYFRDEDVVVIHEILNGKRNYIITKNPEFHYYIEPELKGKKKETEYYKLKSDLKRIDCLYKDRHFSVASKLGVNISNSRIFDTNYDFRKRLMANHNIYGADDSIEYRSIIDYYAKYKDEIDDSILPNYMFFDIEVHSDFNKLAYVELVKIYEHLNMDKEYNPDLSKLYMERFKYILEEADINKLQEYIKAFIKDVNENIYYDIRFFIALMNCKAMEDNSEKIKGYLKRELTPQKLNFIKANIGFPEEDKALNRIDAISFVDVTNRKLYMYLLKVANDLNDEDLAYITDTNKVQNELFKFIELFILVSYLTNIDNSEKEICKELLDNLPYLTELYKSVNLELLKDEDKQKLEYYINVAKNVIPDYDKRVKMDVEYVLFDREIDMIKSFFHKVKHDIQPNIIAAHNAKFDINTLKNRLAHFGISFDKEVNQLTVYNDPLLDNLACRIKIDMLTLERKKDKTTYVFPGLITLDTLLLYAKTASKEKNWSLDAIAQEELKDSKIPYPFEIFEFYMKDIKRFIKYSAVDTLLLMRLEEVIKFIELIQLILSYSKTDWNNYMYRSTYLTNLLKYELTQRKDGDFVLRNNLTPLNPKKEKVAGSTKEISFQGAYNTNLESVKSYGFKQNVYDLDFSSFYPNASFTTNIAPEVLKFTTSESDKHNDYLMMSRIMFGNKYLNLPTSEEIYNEI